MPWPANNFGIIWLKRRTLDAPVRALVARMRAADEAAFQRGRSLPPARHTQQPGDYALPRARHAPAPWTEPLAE
jgi:hypothetical protein